MKKLILLLLLMLTTFSVNAQESKSFKCEGTTYSSIGRQDASVVPTVTQYSWTDRKGNTYPIYISNTGSCYVIKTSNKTGKEYKQYLKSEVSQDICDKLGREYKGKKK